MVAELVTMISTKDPHAFWYFVHSLKTFQGRNGLFELFHGNINCCVCEEVQAKEKEIVLYLPEANETAFGLLKLWGKKIADRQLIPQLKRGSGRKAGGRHQDKDKKPQKDVTNGFTR
ncbi:hypothetical protein OS493_026227 [Desmophyllum pertusum]|uniref:Uncharacterized protein n=1 Tax=Desmophyllum pertusum TaxID=174260 RepID=A0A9X0D1H8_9CNID|nr:hypothetical protein OS493_026227 [Desmophyllum pertusum]